MKRELVGDCLRKSGMEEAQASALSRILAKLVTREYVDARFAAFEEWDRKLSELEAELTWRFYSGMILLATLMTALDLFVD